MLNITAVITVVFIFATSSVAANNILVTPPQPGDSNLIIQKLPSSATVATDQVISKSAKNPSIKLIETQLNDIENGIKVLEGKTSETDLLSPIINVLGVFLGTLGGGFLSYKLHTHQKKFEIRKSLMDWKVKQLAELYGPLYALLHQSNALYRHMNTVLSKADPKKFRLHEDPNKGDFDKKIFQIFDNKCWDDFRTVTHIADVYGQNFGIEMYFDEIILIGERIVKLIEQNAGYVREDQANLANVFGTYLAHYAVLRKLHDEQKTQLEKTNATSQSTQIQTMSVDKSAAFPREIQGLIQYGYNKLNIELNNWGDQGDMKS